jgi:hypothetical protein
VIRDAVASDQDAQRQSLATMECEEAGEILHDRGTDGSDRDSSESEAEAEARAAAMRHVRAGFASDSDPGFDDKHVVSDGKSSMRERDQESSGSEVGSEESEVRKATLARVQRGSDEEEDFKEECEGRGRTADGQRCSKRLAVKVAVRAQESEQFQPTHVDATKCKGLVWAKGYGRQCRFDPLPGTEFCGHHKKRLAFGKVTGPIPLGALAKFRKETKG